jgi:uncharacterized phage protein (TIGR01671 family)
MREIKFKYYWKHEEKGIVVSKTLTLSDVADGGVNVWNNKLERYGAPFAIVQYTGLKDKNGVEIYEGDIIYVEYNYIGRQIVIFEHGRYNVSIMNLMKSGVIGNIHESIVT